MAPLNVLAAMTATASAVWVVGLVLAPRACRSRTASTFFTAAAVMVGVCLLLTVYLLVPARHTVLRLAEWTGTGLVLSSPFAWATWAHLVDLKREQQRP